MTPDAAAVIACESVLEPILEQLTAVLEEALGDLRRSRRRGT